MSSDLNILKIENISKYFGGLAAVSNCSLTIKRGTITGIIGLKPRYLILLQEI